MKAKLLMIALFTLVWAAVCGCTDADETRRVLRAQGYSNIVTGGHAWFACSEDDEVRTKFVADNPKGVRVSGVVCCGLIFKNCTVRF